MNSNLHGNIKHGEKTSNALFLFFAFFFIITAIFPTKTSAQKKSIVVISPLVGELIDSMEAIKYGLFRNIKDFHSASFYQSPDNTLWVIVHLRSAKGIKRDSTYAITFEDVNRYVEKIDNRKILKNTDSLSLAPNTRGLSRPMFETIRFDFSIGVIFNDISELQPLTNSGGDFNIPLSFFIQIPLIEEPSIVFISGWGFALGGEAGGSVSTFSSFILYRPNINNSPKPFFGLGIGYTSFSYGSSGSLFDFSPNFGSHGILIDASESYPIFIFGFNIVPNTLDILFTYPLAKKLTTTYETDNKSYTINPAGCGLSLLISLY